MTATHGSSSSKLTGGADRPSFMPQYAVRYAAATADILRASGAGKQRLAICHTARLRDGGSRDGAIPPGDVQNLRPEPFAGVNAANIARGSSRPCSGAQTSDFVGLFPRRCDLSTAQTRIRSRRILTQRRRYRRRQSALA